MKSLIVYYSLTNGNTKRIAEMLQQATQADIAEIQTVTPYTGGYDAVVAQGQEEVNGDMNRRFNRFRCPLQIMTGFSLEHRLGGTRWHQPFGHSCTSRISAERP